MDPTEYRIVALSPRTVLRVSDDRETSSADTDDVELIVELDGRVVIGAAFELSAVAELRDALNAVLERQLPPAGPSLGQ